MKIFRLILTMRYRYKYIEGQKRECRDIFLANPSAKSNSLSPTVSKHIQRLGGTFTPNLEAQKERVINGFVVPEPIRQFRDTVIWAKGVTYRNEFQIYKG